MSKKKRKIKKQSNNKTQNKKKTFSFNRRSFVKLGVVSALAIPAYVALSAHTKKSKAERDLSVIGNGTPTLIQVHDETCPSCRQLLSSVKGVINNFPDIQFKIADLRSNKGIKFASKHQVYKVTLMYFDSRGRKVDVASGLQTKDEVSSFIKRASRR